MLAVAAGLAAGLLVLLICRPTQALPGFAALLTGGFASVGTVLYFAAPTILTGLSVALSYHGRLFNIGASGQFTVGACAAVLVGVRCGFLGAFQWAAALLAAVLAGALWGLIPGLLRAKFGVSEVLSGILCNYIAMYGVNAVIRAAAYDSYFNRSLPVEATAVLPSAGMGERFGAPANIGILMAVLFAVLVFVWLRGTSGGFSLKLLGQNPEAAAYAGVGRSRVILSSLMLSGALAALGGAVLYLSGSGKFLRLEDVIAPEGFTGISVALLACADPLGTVLAGLFVAHLKVGGSQMQLWGFKPEIADIVIAVILWFSAFASLLNPAAKIKRRKELRR